MTLQSFIDFPIQLYPFFDSKRSLYIYNMHLHLVKCPKIELQGIAFLIMVIYISRVCLGLSRDFSHLNSLQKGQQRKPFCIQILAILSDFKKKGYQRLCVMFRNRNNFGKSLSPPPVPPQEEFNKYFVIFKLVLIGYWCTGLFFREISNESLLLSQP